MKCELCPRECGVERDEGERGFCKMGAKAVVAKHGLFSFEEPIISGKNGSGAVFFSGCSLACAYCQNFDVSHHGLGKEKSDEELAEIFRELQMLGAENINLVNPTHFVPQIESALKIFHPSIPIVWNSHGYEKESTIERVANFVDIFLPDLKYVSDYSASRYSNAGDYFLVATKAIKKMTELKPTVIEGEAIKQGVLVRHLILPLHSDDSIKILSWIRDNLPSETLVSVMSQYTPYGDAKNFPEINRRIASRERKKVLDFFETLPFFGYSQSLSSASELFIPSWDE